MYIHSVHSDNCNAEIDAGVVDNDDDDLGDDEGNPPEGSSEGRHEKLLKVQLGQARRELESLRKLVQSRLGLLTTGDLDAPISDRPTVLSSRDDDTHYFESYAYNGTF
jgi:hypothetical protein